MDLKKIRASIRAREAAEELLTLVPDVLQNGACELRFWEVLSSMAAARAGRVLIMDGPNPSMPFPPMGDDEARDFEGETIPYGKHAGAEVGDVHPEYWIKVTESEFNKKLIRYMRSVRFHERQS